MPALSRRQLRWSWRIPALLLIQTFVTYCVLWAANDRAVSELQASGEPLTHSEFLVHTKSPARDSAGHWRAAIQAAEAARDYVKIDDFQKLLNAKRESAPSADLEYAELFLHNHRDVVDQLCKAAEAGEAGVLPSSEATALSTFYTEHLLEVLASMCRHRQDYDGEVEALLMQTALNRALHNQVCSVVSTTELKDLIVLGRWMKRLDRRPVDSASLRRLSLLLEDRDYPRWLKLGMWSMRIDGLESFERTDEVIKAVEIFKNKVPFWQRCTIYAARPVDRLWFLEVSSELCDAAELRWPAAVDQAIRTERRMRARKPTCLYWMTDNSVYSPVRQFVQTADTMALNRAARAAIACELFRREHGKAPERLDQLVPGHLAEVPTDPYTGRPMRYRADESEIVVYSVGRNRRDDGGRRTVRSKTQPDAVFRIRQFNTG